jgi:hypothetical protein
MTNPVGAHLNGGLAVADAETAMREIATRIGDRVNRIPDGETGERNNWIFFQVDRLRSLPGVETVGVFDPTRGYDGLPKLRITDQSVVAEFFESFNPGYADAYLASYGTFTSLRGDGTIPGNVRFQVQYPTPFATAAGWFVPEQVPAVLPAYTAAMLRDLNRLLAEIPPEDIAVQWDVAVEFGALTGSFPGFPDLTPAEAGRDLGRLLDAVPQDIPAGLHLCYGDYQHVHFKQPESLALQIELIGHVAANARRTVNWFAITVPQNETRPEFFAPLADLRIKDGTEVYFGIVPYHVAEQPEGTSAAQIALIDAHVASWRPHSGEEQEWGVCTECGMARAQPDEIPGLLDLHAKLAAPRRVLTVA